MNLILNLHGFSLQLGAWFFYLVAIFAGALIGRWQRPGVPGRNAGALYVIGGLLGASLVAIAHMYPSFWAVIPAALAVLFALGLRMPL